MKIIVSNVSKSFGEKAVLRDVSFTVPEGGTLVLTGDSGSGKTTLLRILIGLERADAGEIRFEERAPESFGVVFQEDRLVETASAMENVRMIHKKSGRPSDDEIRAALLELLPEESLKLPVLQFSGGMKRRLAVVRAMLSHGEVNNLRDCLDAGFGTLKTARSSFEKVTGKTLDEAYEQVQRKN